MCLRSEDLLHFYAEQQMFTSKRIGLLSKKKILWQPQLCIQYQDDRNLWNQCQIKQLTASKDVFLMTVLMWRKAVVVLTH